ncbi:MAG: hypothetical protein JWN10_2597 [Solirubrobacterales bacterium]|nr:hypothetical protein [Solirubrobacterales bacterium]
MAGKPAEPPHSGRASTGPREQHGELTGSGEREGPLAVERHVKDDGRALILYRDVRRAEDAPRPA